VDDGGIYVKIIANW